MKRWLALLCAVSMLCVGAVTVSAETRLEYVTDYVYSQIITGGENDKLLYSAYDNGNYVIGTMDETGELTREAYSAARWDALVKDGEWSMTVVGDASALCPYAHTHGDNTVCPYLDVDLVNYTNKKTGASLKNYYVPTKSLVVFPSTGAHICFGRYGFVSPVSLKWDGESRYMALKNGDGLWGVYDTATDSMVTEYLYHGMSAVSGDYVKVSDGTAWGRLDLTGVTATTYRFDSEEAFSICEELRTLSDGTCQVFNADNQPISVVFEVGSAKTQYASDAHLLLVTAGDKTQVLYDLNGDVAATFDASVTVSHLQGDCYAVSTTDGVALARADGAVKPDDTVMMGDTTCDGIINSSDVRGVLCHVVEMKMLTQRGQRAADVNADGEIDTKDARIILETILH